MKTTFRLLQWFYVLICIFYSPNKLETTWSNMTEGQETHTTKSPGNSHEKVNLSQDMQQVSWQKEDDSFSLENQSHQSPGLFWGQISSALGSLGCWSQLTRRINPEEVMIQLPRVFSTLKVEGRGMKPVQEPWGAVNNFFKWTKKRKTSAGTSFITI